MISEILFNLFHFVSGIDIEFTEQSQLLAIFEHFMRTKWPFWNERSSGKSCSDQS